MIMAFQNETAAAAAVTGQLKLIYAEKIEASVEGNSASFITDSFSNFALVAEKEAEPIEDPTDPEPIKDPTEPEEPIVDPTEPTKPEEPIKETDPVEPTKPVEDPTDPVPVKADEQYTITLEDDDHTVLDTVTAEEGQTVEEAFTAAGKTFPATPTEREGYTARWICNGEKVVPEAVVTSDMTITAEYTHITHTVTFIADGNALETRTVNYGDAISEFPAYDAGSYTLVGWFNGETEVTAETLVKSDLTVTAKIVSVVTFYNRDAEVHTTVNVVKGEAIGDQLPATIARDDYDAYWAIGEIVQGGQGHEISVTGARIDATWVPTGNATIVPDYQKIIYTVTFYKEDKTTVFATKTVDSGTSYCLNDIPTVPQKDGDTGNTYKGTWYYADGEEFTNRINVRTVADQTTRNLDVWVEYEQNVFTVVFMVEDAVYYQDSYYKGNTLTLPSAPVVEGKDFIGWFTAQGTEYTGGETINSDLVLEAAFDDQFKVEFVIIDEQTGEVTERLSQYFRSEGEAIGQMPQDPFVSGKVFLKWVNQANGEEVTADTVVNGNIVAVATFRTIEIYKITAEYYYINDNGGEVIFNTDLLEAESHELPYTITAPATTQTDPNQVHGGPVYYPESPTLTIRESDFTNYEVTVRFKYVPYTAIYDFVYLLKNLDGNGYTEIDRQVDVQGVLNSYVTPTVKTFSYAVLELAEGATITTTGLNGQPKQELPVYYTRKNFQLTYESNGGSYVTGVTVPYGTQQTVTSTVPTKAGYTFAGWYLDEDLTQAAGNTVTINDNTTLYAKWNGDTVNYTIVYMFEKYNDAGTQSSYVYDNSKDASGTVGNTVYASSAPTITRKGWEIDNERNATSSVVIAADGSSVLNVYYKLTTYTFYFQPGSYGNYGNVTATFNGDTKTGYNNYNYTMTVKLGQDISSTWLTNVTNASFTYGGRTYRPT